MLKRRHLLALPACVALALGLPAARAEGAMDPALRSKARRAIANGLHYLRTQVGPDGSLLKSVGVTALSLRAFLESPAAYNESDGGFVTRQVDFLLANVKPDGAISESMQARSYNTAVALNAFAATKNPKYKDLLAAGRKFLISHQMDENEGYTPDHRYYGGIGYSGGERPDLSNVYFALEGLKAADTDPKDPVWQKALKFVSRNQNRREQRPELGRQRRRLHLHARLEPGAVQQRHLVLWRHDRGRPAEPALCRCRQDRPAGAGRLQVDGRELHARDQPRHRHQARPLLLLQRLRQGHAGLRRGRRHRRQGPEAQLARRPD
jgi:hypothetical protein